MTSELISCTNETKKNNDRQLTITHIDTNTNTD